MLGNGRIIGPFSTQQILKMISEGSLSGTEYVRYQKGGQWIQISREPQFFDQLINQLNAPKFKSGTRIADVGPKEESVSASASASQSTTDLSEAETVVRTLSDHVNSKPVENGNPLVTPKDQAASPPSSPQQSEPVTIDMTNLDAKETQAARYERFHLLGAAAMILSASFMLLGYLFWSEDEESDRFIRLRRVNTTASNKASDQEIQEWFRRGVAHFARDEFSHYLEAQIYFVKILESRNQYFPARTFLCLTYRELWPFARQDAYDFETFNTFVKQTKTFDPVGETGAICEISKLIAFGQIAEARGIAEYYLNQREYSSNAFLIGLSGELAGRSQIFNNAVLILDTAIKHWDAWTKFHYLKALYAMQNGADKEAYHIFSNIVERQPTHRPSWIQKALIEYRIRGQKDLALKSLLMAEKNPGRISRQLEVRLYNLLVRILVENKDLAAAQQFAQKALEQNLYDEELRSLVEQLGLSIKSTPQKVSQSELMHVGDQYLLMGDCLSAQAEYKTAFEMDPTNPTAAFKAAKCLWKLNQPHEAIEWLKKAISIDPAFLEASVTLATYLAQRFDFIQALDVLSKAAKRHPNHPDLLRGLGIVEFYRNNMSAAVGYFNRSLKIADNNPEVLVYLAKAHAALGEQEKAQNAVIRALEIDSTHAEAIVIYAKNLVAQQGSRTGINYLNQQIEKFAYTVELRVGLAEIYLTLERYLEVEKTCRQILDFDAKQKKAWIYLGKSLQAQLKFNEAIKSFIEASILDPFDAEPLVLLAMVYLEMNQWDRAMSHAQKALKANPNYPGLLYLSGLIALKKGDLKLALDFAMKERKKNPNLADSYLLAAEVYDANREFDLCASEYQKAAKLRGQNIEIYLKMSRCYRLAGQIDVAESILSIARSIESGRAEIYREQGAIFEARLDHAAAAMAYEKYLMLSPNAKDKIEIEERLRRLSSSR
ncbi:MAG: tetratricopeptide repeat protein [Bdellovibrionaceae bacterium]|nr:tetratricopeptide repeat protein [Pseudobdellovibrionaceae bacterium]